MGWFKAVARSDAVYTLDRGHVAAIDGAPFDVDMVVQGDAARAAAPGEGPIAEIGEETRRRQLALLQRYVVAVRAR